MAYDVIRALRTVCMNSYLAITVVDITLWIVYALITFIFLISRTNGEVRGYVLLGELIGFGLTRISISKFICSVFGFVFKKLKCFLRKTNTVLNSFYEKVEANVLKALNLLIKMLKTAKKLLKNAIKLLYTNKNIVNMEKTIDYELFDVYKIVTE